MQREDFNTRLRKCSPANLVELIDLAGDATHSARARTRSDQQNTDFLLRGVFDNADCDHAVKLNTVNRLRELTGH